MNIMDFFLRFSSNAKDTTKDVKALGKEVKSTQEEINKSDEALKHLGLTFGDLVKAIVGAETIEGVFKKIADFGKKTIDTEIALHRLSKLTGVNVADIDAWDRALQRFGTPAGEFSSWLDSVHQKLRDMGQGDRAAKLIPTIIGIANSWKDATTQQRQFWAAQYEIPQNITLALDAGGDQALALVNRLKEAGGTTQELTDDSLALQNAWLDVGDTFRDVYHESAPLLVVLAYIIKGIGSSIGYVLHKLNQLRNSFSGSPAWLQAGAAALFGAPHGTGGAGTSSAVGESSSNQEESRKFWLSQGYSRSQVAALLGNEQAESKFNQNAVGDNGTSFGIFQWHDPSRRAAIQRALGIDVTKSSHGDQLRAAAWELQQSGFADRLKGSSTPEEGAAVLTQFENPAHPAQQAALRGKYANYFNAMMNSAKGALSGADSIPPYAVAGGGSSSRSVTIGSITINTQATDADGIARAIDGKLTTQLKNAMANADDSIVY